MASIPVRRHDWSKTTLKCRFFGVSRDFGAQMNILGGKSPVRFARSFPEGPEGPERETSPKLGQKRL
jgi:hypothetical protein